MRQYRRLRGWRRSPVHVVDEWVVVAHMMAALRW